MGCFRVELTSELSPAEAFDRLLDLDAHSAVIPFTTLTHHPPLRVGSTFVARTAVGPLGFDDPMMITEYAEPGASPGHSASPGHVVFRKTGRWIVGHIVLTVAAAPAGRSQISWQQDIKIGVLPAFLDPVVSRVARLAYATGLRRLLHSS